MTVPVTFWLLFGVAMLISAIGFYKYVYFISLGYGFSIAGLGILMLVLFRNGLTVGTILACVLFFLYGCRLGGYRVDIRQDHLRAEFRQPPGAGLADPPAAAGDHRNLAIQ